MHGDKGVKWPDSWVIHWRKGSQAAKLPCGIREKGASQIVQRGRMATAIHGQGTTLGAVWGGGFQVCFLRLWVCLWGEKWDKGIKCTTYCTQVQSFTLLYIQQHVPWAHPSGLFMIPVVQQLSHFQIKWNEAAPSSKALFGTKPVTRHPQSSPCCCHTQGYGEARSHFEQCLCISGTAAHTTVGGYLQSASPSRLMVISLASRLLPQASLILGHLPERCSTNREGSEALCSLIFPGWALCCSSPALLAQAVMGENCISLLWPLDQLLFPTPSLLQINDFKVLT